MSYDQSIRRFDRLTKLYALIAVLYGLSTAYHIAHQEKWVAVINCVGAVMFVALTVMCHRKRRELVIREINRKFGVLDE